LRGIQKYWRILVMAGALAVFFFILLRSPPEGLDQDGQRALAIFALCVILWATNVIPLMITSLLAIILFPLLSVLDSRTTFSLFGNQAVFFILGAFILASSLMRSGLSTRIALMFLKRFGRSPKTLLASVLLFPAFMSFWMSEHAVAAMMFPIVAEIVVSLRLEPKQSRYAKSLFLAMAWGSIIGGIATFLGGARAPLAVGILQETTGQAINFVPWALAAIPTVICMTGAAYVVLIKLFPGEIDSVEKARSLLEKKLEDRGRISRHEIWIGLLMLVTIICWITIGHRIGLANIALSAVVIAFVFNLMNWREIEEDVNWGIFLMYGGAICLGLAMHKTGATYWITERSFALFVHSPPLLILTLSAVAIFLTEGISNAAVVAMLMPMAMGLAGTFNLDAKVITLAITIPSGLPFMMPMGTPATAIAYSSGHIVPWDTIKGGFILNISALIFFNIFARYYWPVIGFSL
jgi:sodium-dependent dicarboxylate transporter 2/3/5